ncbi:conserved hypothetical protein [Histoplasma capsulatum var. duboisii H88]|uniref:Uncharacterized protein n=2 Tax=Ajellomyces capsulatus TaxID=5037 RepID=F0UVN3_AJEC8|nr:conserved hypothetical protein [Histoplasma capsulatum H143]EGC49960.1 conserved hypothetical protein [Histoplasma capsulatum var. duboisii H88]
MSTFFGFNVSDRYRAAELLLDIFKHSIPSNSALHAVAATVSFPLQTLMILNASLKVVSRAYTDPYLEALTPVISMTTMPNIISFSGALVINRDEEGKVSVSLCICISRGLYFCKNHRLKNVLARIRACFISARRQRDPAFISNHEVELITVLFLGLREKARLHSGSPSPPPQPPNRGNWTIGESSLSGSDGGVSVRDSLVLHLKAPTIPALNTHVPILVVKLGPSGDQKGPPNSPSVAERPIEISITILVCFSTFCISLINGLTVNYLVLFGPAVVFWGCIDVRPALIVEIGPWNNAVRFSSSLFCPMLMHSSSCQILSAMQHLLLFGERLEWLKQAPRAARTVVGKSGWRDSQSPQRRCYLSDLRDDEQTRPRSSPLSPLDRTAIIRGTWSYVQESVSPTPRNNLCQSPLILNNFMIHESGA